MCRNPCTSLKETENNNKMSPEQILVEFKTNIINFLDELIEQFPAEADFVVGRYLLKDCISAETMMTTFIKEMLPFRESIKNRDEAFFLNGNMTLLQGLDKTKVNHFKMIWKSSALDESDREIIWKWFDIFIYLVDQYQKKNA